MNAPPFILTAGRLELELSPSDGGSVIRFDASIGGTRHPVLRGCKGRPARIIDAANFPLVPFVNRVRGGSFVFRGRPVRLSPNLEGDPSPLHGQGWRSAWQVDAMSGSAASLRFDHPPGEWPWAYRARQHFKLEPNALSLRLECLNLSDSAMPCGLGQHPYFNCGESTRIDTIVTHAWTIDEHVLPVEKVPATGRFDLRDRHVCGQDLDHGFAGWKGLAKLRDPDWPFDIAVSSPDAPFFQLYSPVGQGICVAEPVTHANAALNAPEDEWPDLGLRILEPGETMHLDMRIEIVWKGDQRG